MTRGRIIFFLLLLLLVSCTETHTQILHSPIPKKPDTLYLDVSTLNENVTHYNLTSTTDNISGRNDTYHFQVLP